MARTILLPTDGSATAKAARRFAVDIARGEGDAIVVFTVAQPADDDGVEDEAVTDAIAGFLREAADAEATVEVAVASRPDEEIVERARALGADVIVMGTHGRTGLARAVIGSTADRVMRRADVPVALVPLAME